MPKGGEGERLKGGGGAPSPVCARGGGEGGGGSMLYPGQMGTDLNPTEYAFRKNSGTNGDGVKMFICGHATPTFEHLRPQAPSKMGTPDAAPAENQGFSPGDPDLPRPQWGARGSEGCRRVAREKD